MDGELHGEVAMTNSRCESIMWDVGQKEVGTWLEERASSDRCQLLLSMVAFSASGR